MDFLNIGQEKSIYADGLHDDTKAIQTCLDKMRNGGTVYFPDGVYLISSSLIFYSGQWLKFSDNAVLLRSSKSDVITKYMLASYSDPDVCGYDGVSDVVISGGVFDGNAELTEKLTIVNTVHCKNIVIKNCRFVNGSLWHYIELNSTKEAVILDCVFDGKSYTSVRDDLTSELVQIDAPEEGTYGPVYNCYGELIDFCRDKTPCEDIRIASCIFKCGGFTAIGHHGNYDHKNIEIICNVFEGRSGNGKKSRGFITFMEKTDCITVSDNAFIADEEAGEESIAIRSDNPKEEALVATGNSFSGYFSKKIQR
ncbi:MAG: hypothetical protein IJB86_07030 [Clostridia bacterium]|nr:hypothetical protein [Clostridia bacterium]